MLLTIHDIIPEQRGFLPKRSVGTNVLIYTNFCFKATDHRMQVDRVYTDFSKAFDKINHNILITKQLDTGRCGRLLNWIESYLTGTANVLLLMVINLRMNMCYRDFLKGLTLDLYYLTFS